MKKIFTVISIFLLSCLTIYSNEVNNQSGSNSFSSQNFIKKLSSLTPENPEKTEKFANYINNEMQKKKEVIYFIKVDRDEKKVTVLTENGEILYDESFSEEIINSFPAYQTKIREVEEKGKIKSYLEANYMERIIKKNNSKRGDNKEKRELSKLEANIKLLLKSYDVLNNSIASIYEVRDKMVSIQQYRDRTMTISSEEDGKKIKITYNFDNTFLGGNMKIYMDEVLISQSKIKNLLPDGEIKLFYPDGKVSGTAVAKEGKLDGIAQAFDEGGNVVEEVLYKNNKVVKRLK